VSTGASTLHGTERLYARPRPRADAPAGMRERPWIRLAAFTALAAYGLLRWATLLRPAPGWRLLGLLGLATVVAGGVPLLSRRSRPLAAAAGVAVVLLAFPVSGLRWHWLTHLRVAATADRIATGLNALPNALVPYLGTSHAVRLVIVLGAAVLLLDAAAVLAFAGRGSPFGDGRRAAAALPLIALAVVPSTLIRPELPYLQGLLLFVLLAAFMWGERVRHGAVASAVGVIALAGIGGAIAAPRIDQRSPWVNYRAWAGAAVPRRVDTFNWNQTYGPLRWPRSGHQVLAVQALKPDYWKAENLDTFNGYRWVAGAPPSQPSLPAPASSVLARWTQTLRVTIVGMQTRDVLAAGDAAEPSQIAGGFAQGTDAGTWVSGLTMGPGTSYAVSVYSPHPSAHELATAGHAYPTPLLTDDLTLGIPVGQGAVGAVTKVTFPLFHARGQPAIPVGPFVPPNPTIATREVEQSPYARAYALARRLAAHARTPYAFVAGVQRYLSGHGGFFYNETPPPRRYPLESFLFADKQGYCQQFSGAMAMLLRMGGIPARVGTGFTSGNYNAQHRSWVVTDINAHAWVEAWFPKYGWVRFDPTPTSAPARGGTTGAPIIKPISTDSLAKANSRRDSGASTAARALVHRTTGGGVSWWPIALGLVLVALLAAATWWVLALRRPGDPGADGLTELQRALARTRRPLPDGTTLAGLERRLLGSPDAAAYVRALRMARYGGVAGGPSPAQRRALRHELARGLGFMGRLRALWALPPRAHRS
jgi:transglutaminase-like putative cysteine protease